MPRPPVERILASAIAARGFRPAEAETQDEIILSFDEAEALRLADLDGLYQQAAAQRMGVSRQTFGRIVESARKKTADALLNGKALRIEGGTVAIASRTARARIVAVPRTDEDFVAEHFGHCSSFAIFSASSDGNILSERRMDMGHEAGCGSGLIPALAAEGVTHLLAGRIGEGALRVLGSHGIAVLRGSNGPVRATVEAFLRGELDDKAPDFDAERPAGCGGHGGVGRGHGRGCREGGHGCPGRGEE
ncbi:MAG: DUF134 domain-containing protein [Rectinemataceae bacterium]